jgi:hypothetical protein
MSSYDEKKIAWKCCIPFYYYDVSGSSNIEERNEEGKEK